MSFSNICILSGGAVTHLSCTKNFCTSFVGSVILFSTMKEFWKSVKILQTLLRKLNTTLSETHHTSCGKVVFIIVYVDGYAIR